MTTPQSGCYSSNTNTGRRSAAAQKRKAPKLPAWQTWGFPSSVSECDKYTLNCLKHWKEATDKHVTTRASTAGTELLPALPVATEEDGPSSTTHTTLLSLGRTCVVPTDSAAAAPGAATSIPAATFHHLPGHHAWRLPCQQCGVHVKHGIAHVSWSTAVHTLVHVPSQVQPWSVSCCVTPSSGAPSS